jgi:hypothetical protein
MYAKFAAKYAKAYSRATFKNPDRMESTFCTLGFLDVFDIVSVGSHKYIPVRKLNEDLGLPQGGGVYNYAKFSDGSYLLYTCEGPLAYWSGKSEEKAEFPTLRTELI